MRPRSTQSSATTDARPQTDQTTSVIIRGHAFLQNLRRGHYELSVEARHGVNGQVDVLGQLRTAAPFDELVATI
jgi:hypothetical protein